MSRSSHYLLNVNEIAQRRLELQHQLFEKSSQHLLLKAGLKPGLKVLEVGCGVGSMTTWLAQQVSPQGHVTAIDISKEQLIAAQIKTDQLGLHNVTYLEKDIYQVDQLMDSFDLIYGRMILHHLTDPKLALKKMVSRLKSKGRVVFEEPPGPAHIICYPLSAGLIRLNELCLKALRALGCQYEIAYQLGQVYAELNLQNIHTTIFQPLLDTPEQRSIISMGMREISGKLIELNLVTVEEMEELLKELEQAIQTAAVLSHLLMFQTVGTQQ